MTPINPASNNAPASPRVGRVLGRLGLGDCPALASACFRRLWQGQAVSLVGSSMQNAVLLWHVATLTVAGERAVALGTLGLARLVPLLGLALLGGLAADRFDRRKLMLVTQLAKAAVAAGLGALTLAGRIDLGWVFALTALDAAVTAFDSPARSSLMPLLVPRPHLSNAVSLNTMLFQVTSLAGPAIAGLALVALAPGWLYLVNALAFGAVIAALATIRPTQSAASAPRRAMGLRDLRDGIRYVFANPLVRSSVVIDFLVSLFGAVATLLPIFAAERLHLGPAGYGALAAAPGAGAFAAAVLLVRFERRIVQPGVLLLAAGAGYGAAMILFGATAAFPLALACLAVAGACDTVNMVIRNVIKQLATPDALRGRMNGVQYLLAQSGPQLGALEAGVLAQAIGAPAAVIAGGVGCLVSTALIAWRTPQLRSCTAQSLVHELPEPARTPAGPPPRSRLPRTEISAAPVLTAPDPAPAEALTA